MQIFTKSPTGNGNNNKEQLRFFPAHETKVIGYFNRPRKTGKN